jgi:hypothetical protein
MIEQYQFPFDSKKTPTSGIGFTIIIIAIIAAGVGSAYYFNKQDIKHDTH